MYLLLVHPEVATRDCNDCQKYVYDEKTGQRALFRGKPIPRPASTGPPCHYGPDRCPKVSPDSGLALSDKHVITYNHYLECRAVGQFPDDAVVRRNARVIYVAEREAQEAKEYRRLALLFGAIDG